MLSLKHRRVWFQVVYVVFLMLFFNGGAVRALSPSEIDALATVNACQDLFFRGQGFPLDIAREDEAQFNISCLLKVKDFDDDQIAEGGAFGIWLRGVAGSGVMETGASGKGVMQILTDVINIIMYFVGFAAVLMIIIGGLMYALSSGDEKRVVLAKKIIIGSLIGLAVVLLAWILVNFVIGILG